MDLTLDNLKKSGGFVGGPVKRSVEWLHEGEVVCADVWVKPMSYHTAMASAEAYRAGQDVKAAQIACCICQEDGAPVFLLSDITGFKDDGSPVMHKNDKGEKVPRGPLSGQLTNALYVLINDVSGLGKPQT